MKRSWISGMLAVAICAVAVSGLAADRKHAVAPPNQLAAVQSATAQLTKMYSAAQLTNGVYVGSNFCLACHTGMTSYKDTGHANFIRRPLTQYSLQAGKGVIADYDKNGVDDFIQGVDFNKISSVFDKYKPNAPILSVENGNYFVTVGSLKMQVVFTVAGMQGGSAQRYVVRVPVSDTANNLSAANYYGPLTFSPATGYGVGSGWYDATTFAPKFSSGISSAALVATGGPSSHTAGCIGCHSTGLQSIGKTASGETKATLFKEVLYAPDDPSAVDYEGDGQMELMNIGCEACHGPGSSHIIAAGDPAKIVNPKTLKPAQQAEICGQCHVTGKSVPTGTYNWPLNDATNTRWTPFDAKNGNALKNFYTNAAKYWPDGTTNGGRPYDQWVQSNHATFTLHTVGCPDCHDAHNEGEGALIRETSVQGTLTIPTSAEDNTLCISCHATHGPFANFTKQDVLDATKGKIDAALKITSTVSAHTNHPYAPTRKMGLSNCTGCHMSSASGHTFKAISPDATIKYADQGGMANSCANGCHNSRVDMFGIGVKGTTGYAGAWDVNLAKQLQKYYGEGGIWWNTKK